MTPLEVLTDVALGCVDRGMSRDRDFYLEVIAQGETLRRAREMGEMSGCGLLLRGLLRCWLALADLPVPARICAPYRSPPGAIADLIAAHAEVDGAYRIFNTSGWLHGAYKLVKPGAIVVVGDADPSPERDTTHVYLVERIERDGWPDGSAELWAIEGGQRDEHGRQVIRRRKHEIDVNGFDRVGGGAARPVIWLLDPMALWHAAGGRSVSQSASG